MSSNDKFYISSSKAGKTEGPDRHVIPETDVNIDTFLSLLPTKEIALTAKPTDNQSTVDDDDPWAIWMAKLGGEGSSLSVRFDDPEKLNIECISFNVISPWAIRFSSSDTALRLSFGDDVASEIPKPGMMEKGTPIYFGLDVDQEFENIFSTVSDLFTYAGLQNKLSALPQALRSQKVSLKKEKADKKRNCLWFYPDQKLRSILRLSFSLDGVNSLASLLQKVLPGMTFWEASVIIKRSITSDTSDVSSKPTEANQAAFEIPCSVTSNGSTASLIGSLIPVREGYYLSIKLDTADSLDVIISWLVGLLPGGEDFNSITDILFKQDFFKNHIHLRRIRVDIGKSQDGTQLQLQSVSIDIEISTASFGQKPGESKRATFLVTYNWTRSLGTLGSLQGRLWNKFNNDKLRKIQPGYESFNDIIPITINPAEYIDLPYLIAGETIDSIPSNIPTLLNEVTINLSPSMFYIGAGLVSKSSTDPSEVVPRIDFDRVWLEASFEWGDSANFSLVLDTSTTLNLGEASEDDIATILGSLEYHVAKENTVE